MATLTAFERIDMGNSIFFEDESQTVVNGGIVAKSDASGTLEWDFNGVTAGHPDPDTGHWIVDSGAIQSSQYKHGGVVFFEILGIDNAQANLVWNAFELRDNADLFGLLLLGDDTLTGSDFSDTMGGYAGDDVVLGGIGHDRLTGGAANDTLKGAAGNDRLAGGAGADRLDGGAGADRLEGGPGQDRLTGGAGADAFVFSSAPRGGDADTITDFHAGVDRVQLEHTVFDALGGTGPLDAASFVARDDIGANSSAGIGPEDRMLYDTDTGKLYYDANGSGAGERMLIAVLLDGHGHPAAGVAAGDFVVI